MNNRIRNFFIAVIWICAISDSIAIDFCHETKAEVNATCCSYAVYNETNNFLKTSDLVSDNGTQEIQAPKELDSVPCDTMVELNLDLCYLEEIIVNGNTYDLLNPSGIELLTRINGCDSTVIVNLIFYGSLIEQFFVTLCPGDSFVLGGVILNESNTSTTDTFQLSNGCDSFFTVSVNFVETGFAVNGVELTANLSSANSYQWLLNGSPIPGATNSTWTALEEGNYSLEIETNGFPCTSKSVFVMVSSVVDISDDTRINVYPNPIQDRIFIELASDLEGDIVEYELINLLGQQIQKGAFQNIIPVRSSKAGIVLLRLIARDQNEYIQQLNIIR